MIICLYYTYVDRNYKHIYHQSVILIITEVLNLINWHIYIYIYIYIYMYMYE